MDAKPGIDELLAKLTSGLLEDIEELYFEACERPLYDGSWPLACERLLALSTELFGPAPGEAALERQGMEHRMCDDTVFEISEEMERQLCLTDRVWWREVIDPLQDSFGPVDYSAFDE